MAASDQRPRFFEGQYLGADDLSTVVEYTRAQQARHVLAAHTWGIAVGLTLVERPAPGHAQRRDVFLTPGHAWDGFGRPIVVLAPVRLSEADLAAIEPNPALDVEASGGRGRLVQVWLAYDEQQARAPRPGFEACDGTNQFSRIQESFRIMVGARTGLDARSPVDVAGRTIDATEALRVAEPTAPPLYDASVPFQRLPDGSPPLPRWLIPVGFVRWLVPTPGRGFFVARDWQPADKVDEQIRRSRRYIGVVAEEIHAADGALVLRRRSDDPDQLHGFRARMAVEPPPAVTDDAVWIEGKLRVRGSVKLAEGKLHFRNADGLDEATPLFMARAGDNPADGAAGKRELRIALGPATQIDNRLVVGRLQGGEDGPLSPALVVQSDGKAGVNTPMPASRFDVTGDWTGEEGAARLTGNKPTLRFSESATAGADHWIVGVGHEAPGTFGIARREQTAWLPALSVTDQNNVGVSAPTPEAKLDIRKLPATAGGSPLGQDKWLQIGDGADTGRVWLEYGQQAAPLLVLSDLDDPPRVQFQQTGSGAENSPQWSSWIGQAGGGSPDLSLMSPRVGVGNTNPGAALDVTGNIKLGVARDLFALGSAAPLRVVLGTVPATGNGSGQGFSFTHGGGSSGEYQVSFAKHFSAPPVVLLTPISSMNDDNVLTLRDANVASFRVIARDLVDASAPMPQDTAFSFIALGID